MASDTPRFDPDAAPPLLRYTGSSGAAAPAAAWRRELPVLIGERVSLREVSLPDAAALVDCLATPEVERFISPAPPTVEACEKFILWARFERARGRYACFGVVPHGTASPIGVFQLRQIEGALGTAEWGFALGAAFWGTGYFPDAARLLVDFAADEVGVRRLEARSAIENGRGNAALRKLGAVREGVLRRALGKDGRYMDAALWTILADEWRQSRAFVPTAVH